MLLHLLRRAGDILPTATATTGADRLIDAKLYLTQAYWDVCAIRPWRWARKDPPAQFLSVAEVTGTLNSISGATLTLSATIAASMAGRKFILDSEAIPHRVDTHAAASASVVLKTNYAGDETSGAFTIFDDEFVVATDILAFPTITEMHSGDQLIVIPESEFVQRFPRNALGTTRAKYATFITEDTIRIHPWTEDARLFECAYNYRPAVLTYDGVASTDTPIVPQDSRAVIAWWALERVYADRRDARIAVAKENKELLLRRMEVSELTAAKPRRWVPAGMRVTG